MRRGGGLLLSGSFGPLTFLGPFATGSTSSAASAATSAALILALRRGLANVFDLRRVGGELLDVGRFDGDAAKFLDALLGAKLLQAVHRRLDEILLVRRAVTLGEAVAHAGEFEDGADGAARDDSRAGTGGEEADFAGAEAPEDGMGIVPLMSSTLRRSRRAVFSAFSMAGGTSLPLA